MTRYRASSAMSTDIDGPWVNIAELSKMRDALTEAARLIARLQTLAQFVGPAHVDSGELVRASKAWLAEHGKG